jgi:hypothetical protein
MFPPRAPFFWRVRLAHPREDATRGNLPVPSSSFHAAFHAAFSRTIRPSIPFTSFAASSLA